MRQESAPRISDLEKHHLQLHQPGVECNLRASAGQCMLGEHKRRDKTDTHWVQDMRDENSCQWEDDFWECQ